jgi:hypothetical protein
MLSSLSGCAYRMAAPLPPSRQRLHIIANTPERYTLHVQRSDYHVPADGRVVFDISMMHRGCSVYLFDRIPIRKVPDPTKERLISVLISGTPLRRLSMREFIKLPVDSEGYHGLPIAEAPSSRVQ